MNESMERPNCYQCIYRREFPGDAHSACANWEAKVVGDRYGREEGWFMWPLNFDPVWLISCTGFAKEKKT